MDGNTFAHTAAIGNTSTQSRKDASQYPAIPEKCASWYAQECLQAGWTKREIIRKYAIVIEQGENNLSAYVPDLPGCITTGRTIEEIEHNIREAIELHLDGLREDGEPIPDPHTAVAYIDLQEVG